MQSCLTARRENGGQAGKRIFTMSTTTETTSAPEGGESAKSRGLVVTIVKALPGGGLRATKARLTDGMLIISEGAPLSPDLLARVIADHQAEEGA
jgi:hypothetical protein